MCPFGSRSFGVCNSSISRHSSLTNKNKKSNALRTCLKASGAFALIGGGIGTFALVGMKPTALSAAASPGGRPSQGSANNSSLPPLTLTNSLILFNGLLYGAQVVSKDMITLWGAKVNNLILAGQWWRLVTPAFLHGNLMHLAVNCYSLYNLAPLVENLSGSKRLAAVYLAAAVCGNVASFYGSAAPSLGASGAVFGVGGALAMYFYRNKQFYGKRADYVLKQLWQTLLINLVYGFSSPRIDNWGHFGGLVGGAFAAYLLGPRFRIGSVEGKRGQYLLDVPPLSLLASPPTNISPFSRR